MELFQFKRQDRVPSNDSIIAVYLAGTTTLAQGLEDMLGGVLVNPFTISQAGTPANWGFKPVGDGTKYAYDIKWVDGNEMLAINYVFSPIINEDFLNELFGGGVTALHSHSHEGGVVPPPDWTEITNKPTEFPPSAHTHEATDLNGVLLTANALGEFDTVEKKDAAQINIGLKQIDCGDF